MTGKAILIVDDDELICEMLASMLSLEGYEVGTAENGAVGLATLERRHFDLVLLDLVMPELDGVRFLHLLPERIATPPPILIVSASINRSSSESLKRPGVVGMISKPVNPADLLQKVAEALGGNAVTNR
jgi:CheY-like chemotaxis protein